MKVSKYFSLSLLAFGLVSFSQAAETGAIRLGAGIDYSSGKYGSSDTVSQLYVPLSVAYSTSVGALKLTVPYVRVDGPADLIDENNVLISGVDSTRSGLGDIVLSGVLYDVISSDASDFNVDFGVKVKFGTADEAQGLGTGEMDYSAQLDLLKHFDHLALFGTIGYKQRTDPAGLDLRDVFFTEIGGDYAIAQHARVGLLFDYRPSSISGNDPVREATFYAQVSPKSGVSVQPYILAGFSDSSPDWGAGINFGVKY